MKAILTTLALVSLSASAFAGCGKTEDVTGKLKKIDAEKKEITVDSKTYKLTPAVDVAALDALKGKDVTVTVGHNKAEAVKAKS
jgi:hypothetical protein